MAAMATIPSFYLYGEPRRTVQERFVHVEPLDDRTRPSEWTIKPHVHAELNHLFHVAQGGGTMQADGATLHFTSPCLLLVPAGTIHGFSWDLDSVGSVLTLANSYLASFVERDPDLAAIFSEPAIVPCDPINHDVCTQLKRLARELSWAAPGWRSAAEQDLLGLLVAALRLIGPRRNLPPPSADASLVARFRERIDARFRLREPMSSHAKALGVSLRRLRAACSQIAGQTPSNMLDQRTMLEARRSLLYSTFSIAEVGYSLGFIDPAYFSRFFARHERRSPAKFRKA